MIEWCCCSFYQTGNMFMIVTIDSIRHPREEGCKDGDKCQIFIFSYLRWRLTIHLCKMERTRTFKRKREIYNFDTFATFHSVDALNMDDSVLR